MHLQPLRVTTNVGLAADGPRRTTLRRRCCTPLQGQVSGSHVVPLRFDEGPASSVPIRVSPTDGVRRHNDELSAEASRDRSQRNVKLLPWNFGLGMDGSIAS